MTIDGNFSDTASGPPEALRANFSVEADGTQFAIVLKSGDGHGRNSDYKERLYHLQERLASASASISVIMVDSDGVRRKGLSPDERRLDVAGYEYPIHLNQVADLHKLRVAIGRAQEPVGRDAGKSGGNRTKKIRIRFNPSPRHVDQSPRWWERYLAGQSELLPPGEARGPGARQYWTLAANPRIYDIDEALAVGGVESWTSRGRDFRPGDGVILWRTRGDDGPRGIVAIGEVVGEPFRRSGEDDPFWLDLDAARIVEDRVPIQLHDAPGLPLWMNGPHRELLTSLNAARARGGTVFRLTPEQWAEIVSLARIDTTEPGELVEQVANPLRRRGGQGRGLSAPERRAVEHRAMELAEAHYKERWDTVQDVSSNRPYDLECRSGDRVLRVEVKGTTGLGASVLLTANEVEHARAYAPNVALFVVSEIRLQRDPLKPVGSGGTVRIIDPWHVDTCGLRAVAFECTLP